MIENWLMAPGSGTVRTRHRLGGRRCAKIEMGGTEENWQNCFYTENVFKWNLPAQRLQCEAQNWASSTEANEVSSAIHSPIHKHFIVVVQYTLLCRYNIYKTAVRTKREYHDTKTKNKEVSSAMLSPVQIEYTCVFLIYHMRVYSAINSPVHCTVCRHN